MDLLLENFELLVFAALFAVGYVFGRWNEKRHYASIRQRERDLSGVTVFSNRFPPVSAQRVETVLVAGSVVIAEDYFKNVVAGLYSLIGGRMRSYESLLDRARREAVLRMKAQAQGRGSTMIINVKFQTFAIGGRNPNNLRGVELLAYGTALAPSGTALAPYGTALAPSKSALAPTKSAAG
jgi:uncharacterized protein YbjQ (UPF0145 family)